MIIFEIKKTLIYINQFFLSQDEFPKKCTHFWSLPSHAPSWKSDLNNTLATVKQATPNLHPTTQTYVLPTSWLDVNTDLL